MLTDNALVQIVDAALAEAVRKAGPWLACRPGCSQCCMGPFPITRLDARRLRRGLSELDPERAARVRERAAQAVAAEFGDDDPCPALDPATGTCDLYAARPLTCRRFGPPLHRAGEDLGVCELCFEGATEEEIAACAVEVDPEGLEFQLEAALGERGETTVASCLNCTG